FHDATTDREQLERWFRDEGYTNVGLAIPEGHWVLDVDPRNGGDATLEAIRDQLPTDTRVHETGGGGLHIWYRGDSEGLPNKLPGGIDIKKPGKGYVVAPPSIHPDTGKPYTVRSARPVATFSGPLTVPGSSDAGDLAELFPDAWISGGARALAESEEPIALGDQHDTLVQIAGHV